MSGFLSRVGFLGSGWTSVYVGTGAVPDPMNGVSRDATSLRYLPADASQWAQTLAVAANGMAGPASVQLMQEASAPLADSIGSDELTVSAGDPGYQQAVTGWSTKAIAYADGSSGFVYGSGGGAVAASTLLLVYIRLDNDAPAADRTVAYAQGPLNVTTGGRLEWAGVTGSASPGTTLVRPVIIKVDRANSVSKCYTDQEIIAGTYAAVDNFIPYYGGAVLSPAGVHYLYSAVWTGAAAQATDGQIRTLLGSLGWSPAW